MALSACKHRVSGSLSLPSRGTFHLSLTVLISIGHQVVFSLTGWSPLFHTRFLVSRTTLDSTSLHSLFVYRTLTFYGMLSQTFLLSSFLTYCSPNPMCISTHGLGSSYFARHYSRNHSLFSLPMGTKMFQFPTFPSLHYFTHVMILGLFSPKWVPSFGYLWIVRYLLLPIAFRSLSRPSSALGA